MDFDATLRRGPKQDQEQDTRFFGVIQISIEGWVGGVLSSFRRKMYSFFHFCIHFLFYLILMCVKKNHGSLKKWQHISYYRYFSKVNCLFVKNNVIFAVLNKLYLANPAMLFQLQNLQTPCVHICTNWSLALVFSNVTNGRHIAQYICSKSLSSSRKIA